MSLIPKLRIVHKLPLAIIGAALAASAAVGLGAYTISAATVTAMSEEKILTVALERSRELSAYLADIRKDLLVTAAAPATIQAFSELQMSFGMTRDATRRLQEGYITNNPNAPDERERLDASALRLGYDSAHKRYHPSFVAQRQAAGYGDIYLFDKAGNLIYSVMKREDFAQNFGDGAALADSPLGRVYRAALALETPGETVFLDAEPYGPAGGTNASFIATPVFSGDTKLGVAAFMMPVAPINALLGARLGLGKSGETFIVGGDHLLRNDSRVTESDDTLVTEYAAPAVDAARTSRQPASGRWDGYRGMPMLLAATPVDFPGADWVLVATMSEAEALQPVSDMRTMILSVSLAVLAGATLIGLLIARSIARPILGLTTTMRRLADGDLEAAVAGADRDDEIGEMAAAVEVFRANGKRMRELAEAEQKAADRHRSTWAEMMQRLQRAFGVVVDAAVDGDFGRRVEQNFADEELNNLARSINNLVESVDRGLAATGRVLAELARTDLTHRMEGDYRGAFGALRDNINGVADRLAEIITSLRGASRQLKAATSELLGGANDLSERTTRQAATIEETAAAMEQLART
ncbi:MAG TPA: HAMP domain-containing protein, partial [Alphaproteobacteria bacterium]|nr:HAMP domain-containing protein [Alphaproteobacteria bacterium]